MQPVLTSSASLTSSTLHVPYVDRWTRPGAGRAEGARAAEHRVSPEGSLSALSGQVHTLPFAAGRARQGQGQCRSCCQGLTRASSQGQGYDDDELMLNILRCHLTY